MRHDKIFFRSFIHKRIDTLNFVSYNLPIRVKYLLDLTELYVCAFKVKFCEIGWIFQMRVSKFYSDSKRLDSFLDL